MVSLPPEGRVLQRTQLMQQWEEHGLNEPNVGLEPWTLQLAEASRTEPVVGRSRSRRDWSVPALG